MNAREEVEQVIYNTLAAEFGRQVADDVTFEVHRAILDWMAHNQVVFYQP